jgi:Tol biopolymer transport system component
MRQIDTEKAAVFIVPARGGAERMVAEFRAGPWLHWDRPGRFLAWSPDGKWLVAVGRLGPEYTDRLLRIAPASGEMRPLTSPNAASLGEAGPAISPDGKLLAFSRRLSWSMSALCLLPLSPNLIPAGEVRQLDTGSSWNTSPAWMPDGRALIFSAGMMDSPHLAKIAISGAAGASRLAGVEEYGWQPTLASTTGSRVRLVYTQHFESVNIWRKASADGSPSELITSAHWSFEPDYSLDGKRIAFLSDRSGFPKSG